MCFTIDNAKRFCQSLEDGLAHLKSQIDSGETEPSEKSADLKRARHQDAGDLGYASKKLKF